MLFQLNSVQEIEFLLYLTAIILGFQLTVYFFYRYYKNRDKKLPLNRIILSYGFSYLLLISAVLILTINRFLISESLLKEILYKLGYILIVFSSTAFLYFIIMKEFSRVINLNLLKFLTIISIIPVVIFIIFPISEIAIILPFAGITIICSIYIIIFQIQLIKTTRGEIKQRNVKILLGNILNISSLFFILEIFTNQFQTGLIDILLFIGIILLISGLLIASFGVYGFPAFYEFRWRENLLRLFIINRINNTAIYSYDFPQVRDKGSHEDYKKLFSGGITGIDNMLSDISNTKGEKIRKIKQADFLIYLEYGSDYASKITYSLVVKENLKSNRYFLRSIQYQFENFYKEILTGLDSLKGSEEALFSSFDVILKEILRRY